VAKMPGQRGEYHAVRGCSICLPDTCPAIRTNEGCFRRPERISSSGALWRKTIGLVCPPPCEMPTLRAKKAPCRCRLSFFPQDIRSRASSRAAAAEWCTCIQSEASEPAQSPMNRRPSSTMGMENLLGVS
jgi:hypothetical protein